MRVADVCAGIGSFGRAWDAAGAYCVWACENDPQAREIYLRNWTPPKDGFAEDLLAVDPADVSAHDALVCGFPCQPFSLLNANGRQRLGDKDERYLYPHIRRILELHRPRVVLLENVPAFRSFHEGRVHGQMMNDLFDLGYYASSRIIDAADWVPQRRKRLFILGTQPQWLDIRTLDLRPPKEVPPLAWYLQPDSQVSDAYTLSEKMKLYVEKREQDVRAFTQIVCGDLHPLAAGTMPTKTRTLTASYQRSMSQGTFVRRPNGDIRLLSERECRSLMGLPSDFVLPGEHRHLYRLLGNAVVYPLAVALAKAISDALDAGGEKPFPDL